MAYTETSELRSLEYLAVKDGYLYRIFRLAREKSGGSRRGNSIPGIRKPRTNKDTDPNSKFLIFTKESCTKASPSSL